MSYLPQTLNSTADIERHSRGKTYFFDADSKRFFNSRIGQNAYRTTNPFVFLFTTSEKNDGAFGNARNPRLYSVRAYDSRTGNIDTVGEFQEYTSARSANNAAKALAPTWKYTVDDQYEYALLINEEYDLELRKSKRDTAPLRQLYGDPDRLNNFKRYMGINMEEPVNA